MQGRMLGAFITDFQGGVLERDAAFRSASPDRHAGAQRIPVLYRLRASRGIRPQGQTPGLNPDLLLFLGAAAVHFDLVIDAFLL